MSKFWHNRPLAILARLAVAVPFIWLGVLKLKDPTLFLQSIGGYEILPTEPPLLINLVGVFMPWTEILIGLCLLAGILPRGAALLAFLMLVFFTGAVFVRGVGMIDVETGFMDVKFDCGCGTGIVHLWRKLLENSGMIFASFYLCISSAPLWRLWSLEGREAKSPGSATSTYAAES